MSGCGGTGDQCGRLLAGLGGVTPQSHGGLRDNRVMWMVSRHETIIVGSPPLSAVSLKRLSMINLHKDYQKAFLLEPTKLGRLVDTIHQRLDDHQNLTSRHDTYEVFLTGNRRQEMTSLEQVLALDNSHKRRISRLVLTCSASSLGAPRPEDEVQVDFGRSPTNSSSAIKVVAISVRSETAGWAARSLSEVEEQIERSWVEHTRPVVVLAGLLIVAVLFAASPFVSIRLLTSDDWLTASDIDGIEAMLARNQPLTENELREVSTMRLKNFVAAWRAREQPFKGGALWLSIPMSL
jgi:hypothetical protein